MKTEVKKLDETKREISVEVSGDIVKNKFEDVFKRITKDVKIAGFRPGHAPRDIVEKNYSSAAHEQVLKELIPDIYNEAVSKEKLDIIELPEISDVKLDRVNLSFKATVEVGPEIKLKDYKGLKINYKRIAVAPDDVKRNIDSLKESRKIDVVDDRFARGLGYPDAAELEKAVEKQVYLHQENHERQRIENEIIEAVTKDLNFKLPQAMVSRQLQDLVKRAKVDLAMKGFPREKIDEQENELIKSLEPEAKKQVRIYLVLAEIAKRENIAQDEHLTAHVMEFLLKEADWKEEAK